MKRKWLQALALLLILGLVSCGGGGGGSTGPSGCVWDSSNWDACNWQ